MLITLLEILNGNDAPVSLKLNAVSALTPCAAVAKSPVLLLAAEPNVLYAKTSVPITNPKDVLAVAAFNPLEPPSHFNLSVYPASHSVCLAVVGIEYPAVNVSAKVPLVVIGVPVILNPVGTVIATLDTVPVPPNKLAI